MFKLQYISIKYVILSFYQARTHIRLYGWITPISLLRRITCGPPLISVGFVQFKFNQHSSPDPISSTHWLPALLPWSGKITLQICKNTLLIFHEACQTPPLDKHSFHFFRFSFSISSSAPETPPALLHPLSSLPPLRLEFSQLLKWYLQGNHFENISTEYSTLSRCVCVCPPRFCLLSHPTHKIIPPLLWKRERLKREPIPLPHQLSYFSTEVNICPP